MTTVKLQDIIRSFNGEGDVVEWLKKIKLVCKMQKIENIASLIPLFLQGSAFSVYEQMDEQDKENEDKIEEALLNAFSIDQFSAYEMFTRRRWKDSESVDVF